MNNINKTTKVYYSPKMAIIFFLSISSGIPFLLLLSTLSVWLTESGISKTTIGLFAWSTVAYSVKFLWSPCFFKYQIPGFTRLFGPIRAWLLCAQLLLMFAIIGLGACDPINNIYMLFFWALMVGFFSSCQDILIEGYRINALKVDDTAIGVSASVIGYRIGMLIAGSGAIFLSGFISWFAVYIIMAGCIMIGIIANLSTDLLDGKEYGLQQHFKIEPAYSLQRLLLEPMALLYQQYNFKWIFIFILSFKAGDTIINTMSMPFLLEIGFNKLQIAYVAKTFGVVAMIVGGFVGGVLLKQFSLRTIALFCMQLQILAGLLCMIQANIGNNTYLLFVTMGTEYFTSGMIHVTLIYYLTLVAKGNTAAILFAVLTSIASLDRVLWSTVAGMIADYTIWSDFFSISMLSCCPALFILYRHANNVIIPANKVSITTA